MGANRGTWHGIPRCGMVLRHAAGGATGRRALRGPGAPAGGRGARRRSPQNAQRVLLAVTPANFARALPCGAMGTSRPTAITRHGRYARALRPPCRPRITRAARWGHRALPPLPTRITRGHAARALPGRRATRAAQWSAAGPPGSRPTAIVLAHYPPFAAVRTRLPLRTRKSHARIVRRASCQRYTGISQDNWVRSCHGRYGLV